MWVAGDGDCGDCGEAGGGDVCGRRGHHTLKYDYRCTGNRIIEGRKPKWRSVNGVE